jgi:opacity protein-like surface antigen
MKLISTICVAMVMVLLSFSAQAADSGYISASLSRFMPDTSSGGFETGGNRVDLVDAEIDDAENLGLAYGLKLSDSWRTELALTYQLPTANESTVSAFGPAASSTLTINFDYQSTQLMVNNYLDLAPADANWTPYAGLGLGVARNDVDTLFFSVPGASGDAVKGDTQSNFAWQLSLGSGYRLDEATSLDLRLSYKDLGELESGKESVYTTQALDEPVTLDLRGWQFAVGVTHAF